MNYIKSLVSIIMPMYNSSRYVSETINSILNQTYINWELIIVDDCSTDDSFDIASIYAINNKNISVLKTDTNKGTAFARNLGISKSRGQFITFLDSDDYLDHYYLENQIRFININGPVVTGSYRRLAKNITIYRIPKHITYKRLLYSNPISCLTTMYDQSII